MPTRRPPTTPHHPPATPAGAHYPGPIAAQLDYPDPPLRGEAFVLRPFAARDFGAAAAFADEPDTSRWVPPLPADDADAVVAAFERYRADGELLHLVVADRGDDAYLGEVMLAVVEDGVGEVGCGVRAGCRGRGLATGALRLLDHWSVTVLGIERLQAMVAEENTPGLDLAGRVGFRREGLLRAYWPSPGSRLDVVVFSMLPDEVPPVL